MSSSTDCRILPFCHLGSLWSTNKDKARSCPPSGDSPIPRPLSSGVEYRYVLGDADSERWMPDPEEFVEAFFGGLFTGLIADALFPTVLSMFIESTTSFPLLTRILSLLIPFLIPSIVVISVFQSTETKLAGVAGVLFSLFVFGDVGFTNALIAIALIAYGALWLRNKI